MTSTEKKKAINDALSRICGHDLFARSLTYSRLLTYLVEKSLAEEDLKEYTIGADLFGENYLTNKNDGTVRSKMYKLREKLSKYYEIEGKNEKLIFDIKKGQYNLSFEEAPTVAKYADEFHLRFSRKDLIISSLVISLFILVYATIHIQLHPTSQLWKSFYDTNAQNLVIVSDHYVINERLSDNQLHAVLYSDILNSKTLHGYGQKHLGKVLLPADYTLMSKMSPYGIKILSEWLFTNNTNYNIILESKFNTEDASNNNLIFIGQFKSMNLSSSLFLRDSKVFSTYLDGFKYLKEGNEKVYNTTYNPNGRKEYAMVSYSSYAEGKHAFYFVSNNDIGVLATLKKFTNNEWLQKFENNLPKNTTSFNALFEVSGLQRTDISCNLIAIETLK